MLEGDWEAHDIFKPFGVDMFDQSVLFEEREEKFL